MKIEIGKEYLTREGKRVTIRGYNEYPFKGSNGELYTEYGEFLTNHECGRDLIAEVTHDDDTNELVIKVPPCTRYRVEVQEREYGDPDLHNKIKREGGEETSGTWLDMQKVKA